ncbi:hypothetical protein ACFQ6Q_11350 [Streptomyces sp. NPDC056437]|uniref:hypothetical protein n=1 Tax=Streptomyces sp. NPDC056437 TaxID=3345816 RepID=UPI0036B78CA7
MSDGHRIHYDADFLRSLRESVNGLRESRAEGIRWLETVVPEAQRIAAAIITTPRRQACTAVSAIPPEIARSVRDVCGLDFGHLILTCTHDKHDHPLPHVGVVPDFGTHEWW